MVSPLNAFVPIVDPATGRPSPEFILFWQTQLATNATIPDLTTAAAVSNTLDMLGGTPGSVLLRGSTSWAALSVGTEGQVLRVGSGGVAWGKPKDSDLALTDITTNNVSVTKHGFAPKAPNDATKFLNGVGAWAEPKDTDLSLSDVSTNNVSTTKHGFAPKAPNDAAKFLNGLGAWAVPAGGGGGGMVQTEVTTSGNVTNAQLVAGSVVRVNNASSTVLTVPSGLTGTEPARFIRVGTGNVGFKAGAGVTIRAKDSKFGIQSQYSSVILIPDSDTTDTYYLIGEVSPARISPFSLPSGVPDPIVWFTPTAVEVDIGGNVTKILNVGTGGVTYDATPDTSNLATITLPSGWGGKSVFNIPSTSSGGYDFGEVTTARTAITITTYMAGASTFAGYDALLSGSASSGGYELQMGGQSGTDHFPNASGITFFREGSPLPSNTDPILPLSKKTVGVTGTRSDSRAGKLWRDNYSTSRNWKGLMGDMLVFDSVLTDTQILDLHTTLTNYYT